MSKGQQRLASCQNIFIIHKVVVFLHRCSLGRDGQIQSDLKFTIVWRYRGRMDRRCSRRDKFGCHDFGFLCCSAAIPGVLFAGGLVTVTTILLRSRLVIIWTATRRRRKMSFLFRCRGGCSSVCGTVSGNRCFLFTLQFGRTGCFRRTAARRCSGRSASKT